MSGFSVNRNSHYDPPSSCLIVFVSRKVMEPCISSVFDVRIDGVEV